MPDARRRPAGGFPARPRHQGGLRTALPRLRQTGQLPHVLQANEFNANQWVDETAGPLHARSQGTVQLGARADDRRQVAILGAHVVPPERLRIQGQRPRRLRRELADQSRRPGAVLLARGADLPRDAAARKACAQLPDGNFIEDNSPDSEARQALRRSGKAARHRRSPRCGARMGNGQLASSFNLLLPDAMATGNLTHRAECRGARDHRGQEHRPSQRSEFSRPPFAARNACEGARR